MRKKERERGTVARISLAGLDPLLLLGNHDKNLRAIERELDVALVVRNGELTVKGEEADVASAASLVERLVAAVRDGRAVDEDLIRDLMSGRDGESPRREEEAQLTLHFEKRTVRPRGRAQALYMQMITENDIVFGIGPAGTGKTYLAVAMALAALKNRDVDRIVLVRPAVEAGEKLGYLPGDLQEKVDPYLRPLYDALGELISYEKIQKYIQLGVIEILPLAFMRGRTLARSFVILDEAQNTTLGQMKMFLTRLGIGSHAVVTGDITQVDLPDPSQSGLILIQDILRDVPGVAFVYSSEVDVVRHRLVRDILQAFERLNAEGKPA
jgi:phosphate starvation-inducible PhoH-like protein